MAKKSSSIAGLSELASLSALVSEGHGDKELDAIDIEDIYSKAQPRTVFEKLDELAESLKSTGQQQPIVVNPDGKGRYVIEQGERRWRAAKIAGLETLLCIITDKAETDEERVIRQLTENIQRDEMTLWDLSQAIGQLIDGGLTVRKLAAKLGKKESYISLLNSAAKVKEPLAALVKAQRIQDPVALKKLQKLLEEHSAEVLPVVERWLAETGADTDSEHDVPAISRRQVESLARSITDGEEITPSETTAAVGTSIPSIRDASIKDIVTSVTHQVTDESLMSESHLDSNADEAREDYGNSDETEYGDKELCSAEPSELDADIKETSDENQSDTVQDTRLAPVFRLLGLLDRGGMNRLQLAEALHCQPQVIGRQVAFLRTNFAMSISGSPKKGYTVRDWGILNRNRFLEMWSAENG